MILFLAGTSDARALAIELKQTGFNLLATVVTDSAAASLQGKNIQSHVGRLTEQEMTGLMALNNVQVIIDASHPYAEIASQTAMAAAKHNDIPYIRYERPTQDFVDPLITEVETYEEAAQLASHHEGTVMLTTGSKTLATFTNQLLGKEKLRVVCRMLPNLDNMEKCEVLGVKQRDILAIQGPFSKELNRALYTQYDTSLVITKESGKVGSVDEKMDAAIELGIPVILIKRPKIQYENRCTTFEDVHEKLGGYLHGKHEL